MRVGTLTVNGKEVLMRESCIVKTEEKGTAIQH